MSAVDTLVEQLRRHSQHDAASALEASEAKIAALTAENDGLREERDRALSSDIMDRAAATITNLREDSARLDWLERNSNAELRWEGWEEDIWQVFTVNGGRNDREWTLRAKGETVREAIDAARAALRQEGKP